MSTPDVNLVVWISQNRTVKLACSKIE